MPASNPIAQAVDTLHDQWVGFAEREHARLLLWRAQADERSLIDAFLARESDAETAQTTDLFLQLSASFTSDAAHGFALVQELQQRYELAAAELAEGERERRWKYPALNQRDSALAHLVSILSSFHAHHTAHTKGALLALCLQPDEVGSLDAYLLWLQRLVRALPEQLRVIVIDDVREPCFGVLVEAEPERVLATPCALELPAALEAVSTTAGHATPGDQFRLLQIQLVNAVREDALPRAQALAQAATELASSQGWTQLAAGIQMMLAAAYSKQHQHHQALRAYVDAEQHARNCEPPDASAAGEPIADRAALKLARQLRLSAMLGRGAVLLTLRAYEAAAQTYLEGAALAHLIDEPRSELDGYRLAAFCYGLDRQVDKAWQLGMHGVRFALGLDEETRKSSTLPYLGDQLLRLTDRERRYDSHRQPLEQHLNQALGAGWREQLLQAPTS